MNNQELITLHKESFNNKDAVKDAETASCFYCESTYPASEIVEFTGTRGQDTGTVICPKCNIDSVILRKLNKSLLERMYKFFFARGDNE